MLDQSIIPTQVKTEETMLKAINKALNLQGRNKAPLDHQFQEAEEEEALEEGSILNLEGCSVYSARKIRDIQQGRAKSRFRSKKR
jgi:hypothetical protein